MLRRPSMAPVQASIPIRTCILAMKLETVQNLGVITPLAETDARPSNSTRPLSALLRTLWPIRPTSTVLPQQMLGQDDNLGQPERLAHETRVARTALCDLRFGH